MFYATQASMPPMHGGLAIAMPAVPRFPTDVIAAPNASRAMTMGAEGMGARSAVTTEGTGCNSEIAKAQPKGYYDMNNETLLLYCAAGDFAARKERLLREIMSVDDVSWDDAHLTLNKMDQDNNKGMWLFTLPYKVGITTAVGAAAVSIPLVFDLDTALWFNENYVTTEVAPDEDLETWLEVGSWTWGWNEPVLGTVSFVLLALQFARNQMVNLGARPYTESMKAWRTRRLCSMYPKYHPLIVAEFAAADDYKSGGQLKRETDTGYHAAHGKAFA